MPSGSPEPGAWLRPAAGPPPGEVFLALPGLNLNPEKLAPLQEVLLAQGHAVLPAFPEGYFAQGGGLRGAALVDSWLGRLDGYRAQAEAAFPGAALSLFGFSMGGLLGLNWCLARGAPLRRALLVGPALRLVWYGRPFLKALAALAPGQLMVPSGSPAEYRLHRGITAAAYSGLLELERRFHRALANPEAAPPLQSLPPQFIAYSPSDELVSARYFPSYQRRLPDKVRLHAISFRPRRWHLHHLGLGPDSLGEGPWRHLEAGVTGWLAERERQGHPARLVNAP